MNWSRFVPGRSYPLVEGQGNPQWFIGTLAADPIALGSGEWDLLSFASQEEASQAFDQLAVDGMGTSAGYVVVTVDGDTVRFGRYKGFRSVLRDIPGGEVEGWGLERLAEKARAAGNPGVRREDRAFVRSELNDKHDGPQPIPVPTHLPVPKKPGRRILPGEKGYDREVDAKLLERALDECGMKPGDVHDQVEAFRATGKMTDGRPVGWTIDKRMSELAQGL